MKSRSRKILIFVVLLILIIAIANVLFRFVLPIKPVRQVSASMTPTYNKGDILFYSHSDSYVVDDIIIYKPSTRPFNVAIRIIEENPDGTFKVKGDGNPATIPTLDQDNLGKEQIIGKVIGSTKGFVFYPLTYGIYLIIALLLTKLVDSKLKK